MIGITEICRRLEAGEKMSAETFDLDVVFANARRLCKKYKITYDPANPVPSDDDLADRTFQAGVDFVVETGVYCPDTQSVIRFTRDEVLEAVASSRGRCMMGEGEDRCEWAPRLPDSDTRPWYHVGTGIINTEERIASNLVKSYAQIKQANSVSVPALETIDGQMVVSGRPTEVLGAIRAIKIARDALCEAGRPGLAIGNCISTAGTALATIAASSPQFGLRPSDGWLVGAQAEMKFDMGALNKAAYLSSWGANIGNESGPLVGGYGGGPAGAAILNVAYRLIGILVLHCDYHLTFPIHITRSCSTTRDVLWCAAVSSQAISRNTRECVWSLGYMSAGPMTKQFFYETAAYLAAVIPSGVSAQTTHPARAVLNDYITPLEMAGSVEINEACVGMSRSQGNELVQELLSKYEDTIDNAPIGKRYQDCYDMGSGLPSQEYVDLYGEVKEELRVMGFGMKRCTDAGHLPCHR
ncbi:MAG: monomethylamine:corrinoid methyltransferase [Phycisphaerales bacterium]|nr:MAG: monomethylamine:corrinoid methyltransferase [Phycisphaerales bacterium]